MGWMIGGESGVPSGKIGSPINVPILVGVDLDGRVEAWVATRLGCVSFAENEPAAISKIRAQIHDYDRWLTNHQLATSPAAARPIHRQTSAEDRVNIVVVERVTVAERLVHGNTAAFFDWDGQATTSSEIETTLRLLSYSRQDLLDLVHRLPRQEWFKRPGDGQRTVTAILRHIANVEWWYISRIVDFPVPTDGYPDEVLRFLAWTRHRVAARLRSLSSAERTRIALPDRDSGELWSARKVLRRLLYHERYHIAQLRTLITV